MKILAYGKTDVSSENQGEKVQKQVGKSSGKTFNRIQKGLEYGSLSLAMISTIMALAIISFGVVPASTAVFVAVSIAGFLTALSAAVTAAAATILRLPCVKKKFQKEESSVEKTQLDETAEQKESVEKQKTDKTTEEKGNTQPTDEVILKQLDGLFGQKTELQDKLDNIEKQIAGLNKDDTKEKEGGDENHKKQLETLTLEKQQLETQLKNLQDHWRKLSETEKKSEEQPQKEVPLDMPTGEAKAEAPKEEEGFTVINT